MKIKPCPKCGSEDIEYDEFTVSGITVTTAEELGSLLCKKCSFCGPIYSKYDKESAIFFWNMLSDYENEKECCKHDEEMFFNLKKEVFINCDNIDTLKRKINNLEKEKNFDKSICDNYLKLEERLSKLEDSKPVGLAWFNDVYGNLHSRLIDLEKSNRDKSSQIEKELKPVNEACMGKCVLFIEGKNKIPDTLMGIFLDDNLVKYYTNPKGSILSDKFYCAERLPGITYGDEND